MRQSTNWRGVAQPQVWFRIIHVASNGHHRALGDTLREQAVEVALGSKGVSKKWNVGALTRRVSAERVVNALPESADTPKLSKKPQTPRVVELLQMAIEWQRQLDAGEVETQTAIARREGITRARVTQVMAMLRLAPEIQRRILSMPGTVRRPAVTERALRPITQIEDPARQLGEFQDLQASHKS